MDFLSIAIIIFIIMESANIAILYFWPGSRLGNGVGVFNAFSNPESQEQRLFAFYLVNWVAGVKLIFIFLLAVILAIGTEPVRTLQDKDFGVPVYRIGDCDHIGDAREAVAQGAELGVRL